MFSRLARGIDRRPVLTLLVWFGLVAVCAAVAMFGVTGEGVFGRVASDLPVTPGAESTRADEFVQAEAPKGTSYTVIVRGTDLGDQTAVAPLMPLLASTAQDLLALPEVASVVFPMALPGGLMNPAAAALIAEDEGGFLFVATLEHDLDPDAHDDACLLVEAHLSELVTQLERLPGVTATLGAGPMVLRAILHQMEEDLSTGEMISLPIAFLVMIIVFAGFAAACLPLLGALASIGSALGAIYLLTYMTELHTSVINIVTVIGVGLSVDYGLLVVSRFREELRAAAGGQAPASGLGGQDPVVSTALTRTLQTAGRTVMFSALTIAAAIAGLAAFPAPMLRAFGLTGIVVVLIALMTAITLVPACLRLLGTRLAKPSPLTRIPVIGRLIAHRGEAAPEQGVFSKLAGIVQKAPVLVIVLVLGGLAVLAWPAQHVQLRNSSYDLLPAGTPIRDFLHEIDREYPAVGTPAITLVSKGGYEETEAWVSASVRSVPHVAGAITSPREGYTQVAIRLDVADALGPEAKATVAEIRALDAPFEVLATGPAPTLVDYLEAIARGAPLAIAVIAAATMLLLLAMSRSLLIPLTALLSNTVTLLASLGVATWLFQDGHLAHILRFDPVPGLESYIVVLMFVFGFGLAMDYEVFLISRIKEAHDAGMDTNEAVRFGLQRSGRIITSAALIIVLVFSGFAAGRLIVIKEIGLGLAITVIIDATLVRMLLVPATMTVLGRWNWAAPAWIKRLGTSTM
ncbi:MAG: MMPL family transporter [Micrococcales bacterium]|nr:MMPL family transporter [Micrococcales bacterium]